MMSLKFTAVINMFSPNIQGRRVMVPKTSPSHYAAPPFLLDSKHSNLYNGIHATSPDALTAVSGIQMKFVFNIEKNVLK